MKKILILIFTSMMITGCDQYISRHAGGTTTIKLDKGDKLIEATWKEGSLWYLTEPMDSDYVPKKKTFKESSMYGVLEGKVIFIESK